MTEQQDRVNRLIERVERHQEALRLRDDAFVRRYQRFLGSSKSWTHRLRARDWKEIGRALDKWERRLTAFVTEIDTGCVVAEFIEAMPIWRYGEAVFHKLQGQTGDRRCAWLIAPTGCGKSWTMQRLAQANQERCVYLHANKGWHESLIRIATGFARALGCPVETGGAATFERVLEHLKGSPVTLLVDDVHEGGGLMLKVAKTIIDETRSKFILGSYPTGYNRLVNGSTDAMSEAQQLYGRSLKPINTDWMHGLRVDDVACYLEQSGLNGMSRIVADRILPALRRGGNLRALADAIELAQSNADEDGIELTAEHIEAAVLALCPARGEKKQA